MKDVIPLPCIDCITLAVCKQQCKVGEVYTDVYPYNLQILYDKCSNLYDYLLHNEGPEIFTVDGISERRIKVIDYINGYGSNEHTPM